MNFLRLLPLLAMLWLVPFAGGGAEPGAETLRPVTVRIAFTPCAFLGLNRHDAEAAFRVLVEVIGRRQRLAVTSTTQVFEDETALRAAILANQVDLALLDAMTYLRAKLEDVMPPQYVGSDRGQAGKRYLLAVRKASPFRRLDDLRGQPLLESRMSNGTMGEHWLAAYLRCAGLGTPAEFFPRIDVVGKPSAAVLPVFFGDRNVCVVDETSFQLMVELNPEVGRSLAVLGRSEPIADGLVCLSRTNWTTDAIKADILRALGELHTDPAGQQTLTLFRMDRLEPYHPKVMDTARRLFASDAEACGTTLVEGEAKESAKRSSSP